MECLGTFRLAEVSFSLTCLNCRGISGSPRVAAVAGAQTTKDRAHAADALRGAWVAMTSNVYQLNNENVPLGLRVASEKVGLGWVWVWSPWGS